jgi:hypothetical protein
MCRHNSDFGNESWAPTTRCMKERLVGGEAFAGDASMIVADAHRRRGVTS